MNAKCCKLKNNSFPQCLPENKRLLSNLERDLKSTASHARVNNVQYLTLVRMHSVRHSNPCQPARNEKTTRARKYETCKRNRLKYDRLILFYGDLSSLLCRGSRPYSRRPWGGKRRRGGRKMLFLFLHGCFRLLSG